MPNILLDKLRDLLPPGFTADVDDAWPWTLHIQRNGTTSSVMASVDQSETQAAFLARCYDNQRALWLPTKDEIQARKGRPRLV
jgi:hypothetical protein